MDTGSCFTCGKAARTLRYNDVKNEWNYTSICFMEYTEKILPVTVTIHHWITYSKRQKCRFYLASAHGHQWSQEVRKYGVGGSSSDIILITCFMRIYQLDKKLKFKRQHRTPSQTAQRSCSSNSSTNTEHPHRQHSVLVALIFLSKRVRKKIKLW